MQTNLDFYFKKNFEIGKWDINLNTNSILWDNKTKEIFEVSESFSPCIKNIITFFNRKNLILFKSLINRSMEFDTPISDKFQIITSDNKIKHLECVCQVDYQSDKINRIYGSIKDVTHEEEQIIKLKSVIQKYETVCSSIQKAIIIIETKTGIITDCNNQIYDLTAFTNNELTNANYSFLFPSLSQTDIDLNIPFTKETILKRKDNKLVPIQIASGKKFLINDKNFLVCFLKKIDSVETSDILSLIVSKTTDLIIVTNPDGETIWANQSYLKLAETNLEQIIGKKIDSLCNNTETNNEKINDIKRAIQNKEEIENIFQLTNKQNEKYWLKLNLKPIFDQNGVCTKFIAIGRDITTTKNKEIEFENILEVTNQQNNKLLNFAHIVSHNIRSHTSNLQMVLDVIENTDNTTEKLSFIEMFKEGTEKLSETIENLNEVLTIQKNSKTKKTAVHLKTEIEKNSIPFKSKISITHNIEEDIYLKVIPSYLENIIQNIISNAVKYQSPNRYPKLEINFHREKYFHVLSFKDNGLGINIDKNKHKLFGMYKSFHGNDDAKGIGLFIVKNQIEAMKGKIEIESKEGEGSTFKLYFDEK